MSERKLGLALTLAIVLETLEILRRTPRWLRYGLALLALSVLYFIVLHPWVSVAILVALFSLCILRRRIARPQP